MICVQFVSDCNTRGPPLLSVRLCKMMSRKKDFTDTGKGNHSQVLPSHHSGHYSQRCINTAPAIPYGRSSCIRRRRPSNSFIDILDVCAVGEVHFKVLDRHTRTGVVEFARTIMASDAWEVLVFQPGITDLIAGIDYRLPGFRVDGRIPHRGLEGVIGIRPVQLRQFRYKPVGSLRLSQTMLVCGCLRVLILN